MKIRGHHLFCLLHFEGKGYSKEFIDNMFKILSKLENGVKFNLVVGSDDICKFCPHNEIETCKLGDNLVKFRDIRIIELLGLKKEELYLFDLIKEKVYSKVTLREFFDICHGCQWFDLCLSKNKFKNPI